MLDLTAESLNQKLPRIWTQHQRSRLPPPSSPTKGSAANPAPGASARSMRTCGKDGTLPDSPTAAAPDSGMNYAKKKSGVPDKASGTPLRSVCGGAVVKSDVSCIRSTRFSSCWNNWLQQYFPTEKQAVMLTSNTPACFSVTILPQKEHPERHSAGPPAAPPAAFSAAAGRLHRHCAFRCLLSG